ncbi:hypothetical protein [Shewanella baltica]|uniref:hypothetical protein n=1 Tax=Shewanella baltica TaxID=62322 RepID=UPI00325EAA89
MHRQKAPVLDLTIVRPLFAALGIHLNIRHWKLLRNLSIAYIVVVVALFLASLAVLGLVEYGSKPLDYVGCYAYDAMLVGFECSGFVGAKTLGMALNYPLYHLYMPFFVVFRPVLAFAVLAMWFFPTMLFVSIAKLRGQNA